MKKISLALIILIIIGILFIPTVSATYEEVLTDSKIISKDYTFDYDYGSDWVTTGLDDFALMFANIQDWADVDGVLCRNNRIGFNDLTLAKRQDGIPHYVDFIVSDTNKIIGNGYLTYNILYNVNNDPTMAQFWVDFSEWNIEGLSGTKTIKLRVKPDSPLKQIRTTYRQMVPSQSGLSTDKPIKIVRASGPAGWLPGDLAGYYIANSEFNWENTITINNTHLILSRDGDYSKLKVQTENDIYYEESYDDRNMFIIPPITWTVTNPIGTNFSGSYEGESSPHDPDDASVIVYIKNSQTGALIADANVVIDGLVNGEYYPVVNRTEPSGIFSINLQPTGGGQPNPDGYRLIVTADGYNNPMPEINFTVDDYKQSIYCLLDPIAGGPVNENKTFIDFFVRDMSSNPISGATVKFGKYTLITNSAGYTVFEVDKNNNYTWTISKSGYGPLTGNAVIGNDPRHTINTVLAPIVTPTTTTPIPTSPPIGPTPTMTAPTGEPVSNWLEWFAAHFGMILGGGVEIGKIFMWLCFTVPVGVYVGKEAKAGAAGFMAGAGIVTLFFVLIGWVPIWLIVLLALIIGLLYAKVFNAPDNGGGR